MAGPLDIFSASGMVATPDAESEIMRSPATALLEDKNALTRADVQSALPADLKLRISDEFVAKLNAVSMDPMVADEIRNNFIGMSQILKQGKFKLDQYLEACQYVTFKMMGYTNKDAYAHTFPERVQKLRLEGRDDKYISAFVAGYAKNKLVNMILEQALIPSYVLNQDMYQAALNQQLYLMKHASSEKVQTDAANSILTALKQPEKSKVEIDVTTRDVTGIAELESLMVKVARSQIDAIESGASTKEIAHKDIAHKDITPKV